MTQPENSDRKIKEEHDRNTKNLFQGWKTVKNAIERTTPATRTEVMKITKLKH